MRLGLTGRILVGGVLLAVIFVVQFVLVVRSFQSIRQHSREQQRSEQSVVAAIRLEKVVVDLETGARGYVLTGDKRFLEPYEAGRRSLSGESKRLIALAPGPWSARIDRLSRSYLVDYATPLVRRAARS